MVALSVAKVLRPEIVSNLSNLKTFRGTTKKHSMKSIDRAINISIEFISCSFVVSLPVPKLRRFEKIGWSNTFGTDGTLLKRNL